MKSLNRSTVLFVVSFGILILVLGKWVVKNNADKRSNQQQVTNDNFPHQMQVEPTKTVENTERTSSLQFNSIGAEMWLTDKQGRVTGYSKEQPTQEIPNSGYWDSEIVPFGAESDGSIRRALFVRLQTDGIYQLHVFKPEMNINNVATLITSQFDVIIVGVDGEYNDLKTTVSGSIELGETIEYQIIYDPRQGKLLAN